MRICKSCKVEKEESCFHLHKRDKYQWACKECRKKEPRNKDRAKYMREYTRERKINEPWYKTMVSIQVRCHKGSKKHKYYYDKGIKCKISLDELKQLWFRDEAWLLKKASIDRKDRRKGYTFNNCRYIELRENQRQGGIRVWRTWISKTKVLRILSQVDTIEEAVFLIKKGRANNEKETN